MTDIIYRMWEEGTTQRAVNSLHRSMVPTSSLRLLYPGITTSSWPTSFWMGRVRSDPMPTAEDSVPLHITSTRRALTRSFSSYKSGTRSGLGSTTVVGTLSTQHPFIHFQAISCEFRVYTLINSVHVHAYSWTQLHVAEKHQNIFLVYGNKNFQIVGCFVFLYIHVF